MIEPTDEMRRAFEAAYAAATPTDGLHFKEDAAIQLDAGLAAVLAIIERDYDVSQKLPTVEHRLQREIWWNHYAEGYEAECVCGESFCYRQYSMAEERLLDHLEQEAGRA